MLRLPHKTAAHESKTACMPIRAAAPCLGGARASLVHGQRALPCTGHCSIRSMARRGALPRAVEELRFREDGADAAARGAAGAAADRDVVTKEVVLLLRRPMALGTEGRKVFPDGSLTLHFVDSDTGARSDAVPVGKASGWSQSDWDPANELLGIKFVKLVQVPANFRACGAMVATCTEPVYLSSISAVDVQDGSAVSIPANSYLHPDQGDRVFFGVTSLPETTPAGLKALRALELSKLRAEDHTGPARTDADRIYQYEVYDDLGNEANPRPTLGGKQQPYPRRIKGVIKGQPWTPKDDNFDFDKQSDFLRNGALATLPSLLTTIDTKFNFWVLLWNKVAPEGSSQRSFLYGLLDKIAPDGSEQRKFLNRLVTPYFKSLAEVDKLFDDVRGIQSLSDLFKYPPCKEYAEDKDVGRTKTTWMSDEDWGRQFLAGINPMVLEKLTAAKLGASSIQEEHLTGPTAHPELRGKALSQLLSAPKPRLFMVDYSAYESYITRVNFLEGKVLHMGRAVLYLRDDGHLVPVAIELATHVGSATGPLKAGVYTPTFDAGDGGKPKMTADWLVAKAIFMSMDSGVHQLFSHFVRCHACTEPYFIALRRQLSEMHPVFRLMIPHFRYTLKINANARSSLINANGVIESTFTPGAFAMQLSSTLYATAWRFDLQGLPADLVSRGFLAAPSSRDLLLEDYPYAEDGLKIWDALESYFRSYLSLYYKDGAPLDAEIKAWWDEVKNVGHQDITVGWPALNSVSDLAYILTTIAWVASGHHAAVNFGQYDFSAYMPSHSSNCARAMPLPGTPEFKELASMDVTGKEFEYELLSYLADKVSAAKVMTTVQLLAAHAGDEHYLASDEPSDWIKDPAAVKVTDAFVSRIKAVEAEILAANAAAAPKGGPQRGARGTFPGGYTYLIPSSPTAGLSSRGVPYSVSI